jgi:hypothetical protein
MSKNVCGCRCIAVSFTETLKMVLYAYSAEYSNFYLYERRKPGTSYFLQGILSYLLQDMQTAFINKRLLIFCPETLLLFYIICFFHYILAATFAGMRQQD